VKAVGRETHLCFFHDCRREFSVHQAHFHDECKTYLCPHCNRCLCQLPVEARWALDAEMYSEGLWDPWHNPPRRKKKADLIFPSKEAFLKFVEDVFPEIYGRYARGEITYRDLIIEVIVKTDRAVKIAGRYPEV